MHHINGYKVAIIVTENPMGSRNPQWMSFSYRLSPEFCEKIAEWGTGYMVD